jgi:hypothetical protein
VSGLGGSQNRTGRLGNPTRRGVYQGQQEVLIEARTAPAPQAIQPRLGLAPRRARPGGFLSVAAVGCQAGGSHGGLAQKHTTTYPRSIYLLPTFVKRFLLGKCNTAALLRICAIVA